jgi:hypothetical protein
MLSRSRGGVVRLSLVVMNLDRRLGAIESALDARMYVMWQSITVARIASLAVSVAARRVHIVFAMRFHYLRSLSWRLGGTSTPCRLRSACS